MHKYLYCIAQYGERMTTARAQPLTASELTKARDFLYEADLLVTDVKSLFRNSNDFATAARRRWDIARRTISIMRT
jgi:hypothetical protein